MMFNKAHNSRIISLVLAALFLCVNFAYSLRVPLDSKRLKGFIDSKWPSKLVSMQLVGPKYKFGDFKESKGKADNIKIYRGDVFIEGVKFGLEIKSEENAEREMEFNYKLFYENEEIAFNKWKIKGQIPIFEDLKVSEQYRKNHIGKKIRPLKDKNIASVLINARLKDLSLSNKVNVSKGSRWGFDPDETHWLNEYPKILPSWQDKLASMHRASPRTMGDFGILGIPETPTNSIRKML